MLIKHYFLSIRTRLILFVFVVAFIPLFIITFISLRYAEQITKAILYAHLHNITQSKARVIARWLYERTSNVKVLADSKTLRSMDAYELHSYFDSMKAHYPGCKRILLIDPQGGTVADTDNKHENYGKAYWFQKAIMEGEYISDVFLDNDELMLLIAVAISKEKPIGLLCEFIDLQYLDRLISNLVLGEFGESYVLNGNGTVIAHTNKKQVLTGKVKNFEFLTLLSKSNIGLEAYQNYRGLDVIGAQIWISQQATQNLYPIQWLLVAEQDKREVFSDINKYKIGIIILFLFLIGMITAGCILISRTITYPIRKLADATGSIAKGDFSKQLEVKREDEVGRLTMAFNQMAQQLRSYYASLEDRITNAREELGKVSHELEKSREALTRSEKLIALGQVSAGVAHEIRTPLTSIKLFIQSLETMLPANDENLEDLSIIKREIERMEDIIKRFLDFARPAEPKFDIVNINQTVSDAISLIKTRIKNKPIIIETEYDNNLPFTQGDGKQLEQVFLNMLLNSVEAMPDGGKITVTTGIISMSNEQRKLLKITIADTGYGIEPESRPYIFDPFFTTKDSGTGMGLAIAFTVIEQHNGLIEMESELSKGTKFTIYLPWSENL